MQAILVRLQRLVHTTLPAANEILYHGVLGYGPSAAGFDRILSLVPQKSYVNLGFFYGASVADPLQLLEGTGKRMRHSKIRSLDAAANLALVPLLKDAWTKGSIAVAAFPAPRQDS